MFSFNDSISGSKSLWNRALIAQSFFPKLILNGDSEARDVLLLQKAVADLKAGVKKFDCGEGGTTLRFLLARLSREPGEYFVKATERLLERPQQDLYQALRDLGCKVNPGPEGVSLVSNGWDLPKKLQVSLSTSSQFLSGLLLSAWDLPAALNIETDIGKGSESYLAMTLSLLQSFGMQWERQGGQVTVPPGQTLKIQSYSPEPDMSSAFTVAALAVAGGSAVIQNFPSQSLQPDFVFVELLEAMGAKIQITENALVVEQSVMNSVDWDLRNSPDLFPVLSVLLMKARGTSELVGLESLPFKESNRIEKCLELIRSLGGQGSWDGKRFEIVGEPNLQLRGSIVFDPDQDHRMAMAAAVAMQYGADIEVIDPEVVQKSFAKFWEIL